MTCCCCNSVCALLLISIAILVYWIISWNNTPLRFDGKVVFISGGSSGIGEQLTKDFVERGASKVIIAARNIDELKRV